MSERAYVGTGWDVRWVVPWNAQNIRIRLLPGCGIEVRWTESA